MVFGTSQVLCQTAPQPKTPRLLPPRTARAKLCVKRAACGGRNVRLQSIKVLTKRLKRRREEEGSQGPPWEGKPSYLEGQGLPGLPSSVVRMGAGPL